MIKWIEDKTKNLIAWIELHTGSFIVIIVIIALLAPRILTIKTDCEYCGWLHFTDPIGDTIAGITAPILNFLTIILLYLTLKSQNESIEKQGKSLEKQEESLKAQEEQMNHRRDFELMVHLLGNIRNDFEKLRLTTKEKTQTWSGIGAALMIADAIKRNIFHLFTNESLLSFFTSYNWLLRNIENLLKKNFSAQLSYEEKKIIYDQTQLIVSVLNDILKELKVHYYHDEEQDIVNNDFIYNKYEEIVEAVSSGIASKVTIYDPDFFIRDNPTLF